MCTVFSVQSRVHTKHGLTESDHTHTDPSPKSNKLYVPTVLIDTGHTEKLQSAVLAMELLRPALGRGGKLGG